MIDQFLALDADLRSLADGAGDEGVTADDNTFFNYRIAAKNRSAGVYGYIILNGWMALLVAEILSASRGECSKCNTLIQLYVFTDFRGLSHYDTGSMIDKEVFADSGARMNIYSGQVMGILRHHAGNERHAKQKQLMGQAEDGDCVNARV